jgi:hypothetical protein
VSSLEKIKVVDGRKILETAQFQTITPGFCGSKDGVTLLFLPTKILLFHANT